MFLFTQEDRERLQRKAQRHTSFCDRLKTRQGYLAENDLLIPEVSTAQWGQYYHCPDDSAMLIFDFHSPHRHVCPVCGRVMTGDPYDGVWWTRIHNANEATACRLSLHYFLTGDRESADFARRVLLGYAGYYPNYVPHGNVPCNGPGRTHAQTLNEAVFFRHMAEVYDLISEVLTEEEKELVRKNLFQQGADFLMAHRKNQIHNHEVLIDSAIGQLGLILQNEEILNFALYQPYGLLDQLEKGTLEDDFWFEGSLHYQNYALEAFFSYEVFARYTGYSNLDNPHYRNMMKNMYRLLSRTDTLPAANDVRYGGSAIKPADIYEFGYAVYGDPEILRLLHAMYRHGKRDSQYAFLFGPETLPPAEDSFEDYHNENGSGLTLIHGPDMRYLLVNHSPYGGEHDHFDRLSLDFSAFGKQMASDLGTIDYGAFLHYEYFKNTGTHNTVNIDESNQPPARCYVNKYEKTSDGTFLDAWVDFDREYRAPESFALKEWDETVYRGVKMRRRILSRKTWFLDVFTVSCDREHQIDLSFHTAGTRKKQDAEECPVSGFSDKKPYRYFHSVTEKAVNGIFSNTWEEDAVCLSLDSAVSNGNVFYARGINRDLSSDLSYMIQRVCGKSAVFVNLWEAHSGPRSAALREVSFGTALKIKVLYDGREETFLF